MPSREKREHYAPRKFVAIQLYTYLSDHNTTRDTSHLTTRDTSHLTGAAGAGCGALLSWVKMYVY